MIFRKLGRSVSVAIVLASLAAAAQVPSSQHVVLVIEENSRFVDVMAYMPWLVGEGNANGYAANYESDNGGSLMDYLWLASGSCHSSVNCVLPPGTHDFYCSGDNCYYPGTQTPDPITDDNIFRRLNQAGISWKVYAQSYTLAGGTVTSPDYHNGSSYYRRHNAAVWYSDVLNDVDGSSSKIVDLSQLATDLANGALPRFVIIVPDGNHDVHDCPVGLAICTGYQKLAAADQFLSRTLNPILSTSDFQPGGDGLLIVTFDECGGGTNTGCGSAVYTALIGPNVKPHTVSSLPYKHENALRTMLDALGIAKYPGAAATAADMSDFFTTGAGKPHVVVSTPATGASVNSGVAIQASAVATPGHTVTGWYVYADNIAVYHTGAVSAINPTLSMSSGNHTVLVRAWDSSGAFDDDIVTLTVTASKPVISVSTPTNYANVGTPVNIQASVSPTAGNAISAWWIYADGVGVYSAGGVNTIKTNLGMSLGAHTVVVRAWDTSGTYDDQTLKLTVSGKPAIAISGPAQSSRVISPMKIQASVTSTSGHAISGWYVYVDGAAVYHTGAAASISAKVNASAGSHTVLVRAWDSSGAYGDQNLLLRVEPVAVNISTPANRASVNSPVNIRAAATSAHAITGWHLYVDNVDVFAQNSGNSVDANLAMSSGAHSIVVRGWDSIGAYGDQTIEVTVP